MYDLFAFLKRILSSMHTMMETDDKLNKQVLEKITRQNF